MVNVGNVKISAAGNFNTSCIFPWQHRCVAITSTESLWASTYLTRDAQD